MNRYTTRGMAIGLIVASVLFYFYFDHSRETSVESSIQSVKKAGYTVYLNQDDPHTQLALLQEKYDKLKKEKNVNHVSSNKNEETGKQTYFISIEQGMTSKDISSRLYRAGFLKDEQSLNDYLNKKKWANQIQIGEYKITSDMNVEEISQIITNHD